MLLLFAVMGVRKDRISVIFAFLQGPVSVRSGKFSASEQIKNSRNSAIQKFVHCILRKTTSRFHFLVEKVYVQAAIRLSLTQRNRRIRLVHVRSGSPIGRDSVMNNRKPKKVCPQKLDFEESVETCVDFSADATSVNHDHSYFCSQEQATPKSDTNGSDTTLPIGKCSCQTDLTADEIDYLVSELEECRRKKTILSEKLEKKKDLKREVNTEDMIRDDESIKFYTGLPNLACFNLTLGLIQPYTKNIKYWDKKKNEKSYYQNDVS